MEHLKKYWVGYLLAAIVIFFVVGYFYRKNKAKKQADALYRASLTQVRENQTGIAPTTADGSVINNSNTVDPSLIQ